MEKIKKIVFDRRIIIAGISVLLIVFFFVFDLKNYLTLEFVKEFRHEIITLYNDHPVYVIAAYFLIYIVVSGLSLPGAAILGLAAGAIFGFFIATLVVSFASSIGATLACFVSRYLLRDRVQAMFADKFVKINEGINREGHFYLFAARLIPAIPFFVINLVMGLTSMPLRRFYWISQLGMLPGTMLYINAGKHLGSIESLSGITSPQMIISFMLLGILPLLTKRCISFVRQRPIE